MNQNRGDEWFGENRTEAWLVLCIFVAIAFLVISFYHVTFYSHHLDSTFLMEAIASINDGGKPLTAIGTTFGEASRFFAANPENICSNDLLPSGNAGNVFETHAYLFLLPIALISRITSPVFAYSIVAGILYISTILIVYIYLRTEKVSKIGATMLCLLVAFHPVFSYGIKADFYIDRLFIPFGLLYGLALYRLTNLYSDNQVKKNVYLAIALISGILGAMATERAALMIIAFTFAYLVLYAKSKLKIRDILILLVFSLVLMIYLSCYFIYIYKQHPGTGNLTSLLQDIPNFVSRMHQEKYSQQTLEFVWINIMLVIILLIQNWRLAFIAIAAMSPNILATYGGAEKVGWSTHYHAMYFPFLIVAITVGFSGLWIRSKTVGTKCIYVIYLVSVILLFGSTTSMYSNSKSIIVELFQYVIKGKNSSQMRAKLVGEEISTQIPKGARVSTSEMFMPALYEGRTLYYYPIGIDLADYIVLEKVVKADGSFYYGGAISYIGKSEDINFCLNQRLKTLGFDINNPTIVKNFAIIKK